MRNTITCFALLVFSIFNGTFWLISCENQNEEDLYGKTECDTSNVSWTEDVKPILAHRCLHCHYDGIGAIAPFSLQKYSDVLVRVNTGQLESAINHRPRKPKMPKDGPKLPDCELSKINKWISDGAPNN